MLKKTKFYLGITLIVQSITLFITFLAMCISKKSKGSMFFVSILSGVIGLFLAVDQLKKATDAADLMTALNDLYLSDELDNISKKAANAKEAEAHEKNSASGSFSENTPAADGNKDDSNNSPLPPDPENPRVGMDDSSDDTFAV